MAYEGKNYNVNIMSQNYFKLFCDNRKDLELVI